MELAPEPLWEQGSLTGMADVTVERVVSEKVETNMPDAPVAGPALTSSGFSAPVPEHAERLHARDLARRCSAYAELQAKMDAGNADTELWALCGASVDMALAESLPKGQDAALNAVAAYLKHCPGLEAKTVLPWVRKLTEHKACRDEMAVGKKSTGFLKKQIAFIIKLISQLLGDFGIKKMPPKLGYLSFVLKYVSDSDRGIREACYSVAIEMAAWLGDIGDLISPMDEPQKKEVAKRLEAAGGEQKSKPIRCYRGDAAAQHGDGARSSSKPAEKADDLFEKDTTPLGPGPFEVKVSKADAKLGFLFDQVDETRGVMVSEVNTGAIKSFNDSNPKQAIKAYDLVTSFEGASGTKEIAKKLQTPGGRARLYGGGAHETS
eukprot:g23553.t1